MFGWNREQMPCYLTRTTAETHQLIRENLHLSPVYGAGGVPRDALLPVLKIRLYALPIRKAIKYLLSRKDEIFQSCIFKDFRPGCQKQYSCKCCDRFLVWKTAMLRPAMRLSTTISNPVLPTLMTSALKVYSVLGKLTALPATKRQLHVAGINAIVMPAIRK